MSFPVVENPVAFTVSLEDNYSPGAQEKIPYSNIITNVGNGYISERREFVCPQAGLYVFYVTGYGRNSAACRLDITKNGSIMTRAFIVHLHSSMGSNMAVLELAEADNVSVVSAIAACELSGEELLSTFSGFRIN